MWDYSATGQHRSGPCPQQPTVRVTTSGPIQPLVGTSVGSTPKQPTVSKQPLVRAFSANGLWSGSCQAENEVRSGSKPSPWGPPAHSPLGQRMSEGPREQTGGCVYRAPELWPRPPNGQTQTLRLQWPFPPSPPLWPHGSGRLHRTQPVGPAPTIWAAWGARKLVGSCTPGSLSHNSWTASGDLARGSHQPRSSSSQPGLDLTGWKPE